MLLTFVTGGKMMEAYAKGRTGDALKGLMELRVDEVQVCNPDGSMTSTPRPSVPLRSTIYVEPGSNVPFDGTVQDIAGRECFVDESLLTGESRMVRKE
ncbi:hypothetical protein TrRE_jg768, partial [Triparma retinervis]